MEDKVYLPGLNGIRTIAVFIVIACHIDSNAILFSVPSLGYHVKGTAEYGVIMFFVLSGFLITYLLMIEKEKFGKVDLRKFYFRRILRIWPIYYLLIIVTIILVLFEVIDRGTQPLLTFILYSGLLSNVAYAHGLGLITITPLWSIGVEEQFYAFWPFLVNKSRYIGYALIVFMAVYLLIKIYFRFYPVGNVYTLITITSFDSMAMGGVMAYLVYKRSNILSFVYHPVIQVLAWLFLMVSIFYEPVHITSLIDKELHAVVYAIIIVNVSTNPNTIITLENGLFRYIGRISYGLYIYHMVVIVLLSALLKNWIISFNVQAVGFLIVYLVTPATCILLASLSYRYIESKFLLLKNRYSKVVSTN